MNFNNQNILITNKKEVKITELVKLKSFNDREFIMTTSSGNLIIKGNNLEMDNINQVTNEIIIKGDISSVLFDHIGKNDKKKKDTPFIKKLFK